MSVDSIFFYSSGISFQKIKYLTILWNLWLQNKVRQLIYFSLPFSVVVWSGIRIGKYQDPGCSSRIRYTAGRKMYTKFHPATKSLFFCWPGPWKAEGQSETRLHEGDSLGQRPGHWQVLQASVPGNPFKGAQVWDFRSLGFSRFLQHEVSTGGRLWGKKKKKCKKYSGFLWGRVIPYAYAQSNFKEHSTFKHAQHTHHRLMRTLSIRVRNWCVFWAYASGTDT